MEHRDLVTILKSKKVKVIEIPGWGTYLRKQWENHFADHLSYKDKKKIFLYDEDGFCGYLWHLFSYKRRASLQEEQADTAFNKEWKETCYVFYQHSEEAYILEKSKAITADLFENEEDVYIVDKDFNWTYVRTHETGLCGPYFCRKHSG